MSKNDNSMLSNEKNKTLKIIQIYEEDIKKYKHELQSLNHNLNDK